MVVEEKKLDMEVLKTQDKLSDDDLAAIQAEVLADEGIKPEEKEETKEPEKTELTEEEQKAAEKEKEKEEKEQKETESAEAEQEKKRLLEAKEEDLSEEEITKRNEFIKADEDAKQQKEAEDKRIKEELDKAVKDYAIEHKVSEQEARTDFESRDKILEKYKGDPKQLALANLHLQRVYTKSQEELKAVRDAKPAQQAKEITIESVIKLVDDGKLVISGKSATREGLVEAYRKAYPGITENLEDDAVIKLAAKDLKDNYVRAIENQTKEISSKAKDKRAVLLSSLPEADKKFSSDIQPILDKLPDDVVMAEDYNLDALIYYAKGKTYDADLKAFGEKEYQRGVEQAKILAVKDNPSSSGNKKTKVKSKVPALTEDQKQRALEMYEGTTFTEEQKYINYAELMAIENKDKDKK